MGISWIQKIRALHHKMKFLVVISALVAAAYAEAEADADAVYGAYGYAGGLYGAYGYGAGLYGAHGYGAGLYGAHGYSALKSAPCVNAANVPVACAGPTYPVAGYPYAAHYYGKRDADADAEADAALLYGSYAAYPSAYGYGAYPYAGHAAVGYAAAGYAGIPNPVHAVAATPFGLTHSSNVGLCTNYLGAAVSCGRKKREADAEADAALLYGAYPGYPSAYGYGIGAYPYAAHGPRVVATNNVLGHAVATTAYGLGAIHSSHVGVCTNNLGAQVPC